MNLKPILRRDFLKTGGIGAVALSSAAWRPWILQGQSRPEREDTGDLSQSGTTVIEDIAKWVSELGYKDLPPEVIRVSKRVLLDSIGCVLGGVNADPVRMVQRVASAQGGKPQATVLGVGWKTTCDQAAFLNAMALRYLDYMDYAGLGRPHHPSVNVAAALAVAEMQGLSGKDLLLGITIGYEIMIGLRDAAVPVAIGGWDYNSITAQYSAAAVAGRLLGLDASRLAHALAIAGSNANTLFEVRAGPGTSGRELTPSKGTAEPMGIKNGTFAALLAQAGLTYPLTILDGKHGYGKMVSGILKEEMLRKRSGDFQVLKSCIKLWPSVGTSQAPIAAALEIRRKIGTEEIERITVDLSDWAYRQQADRGGDISAREHADQSVPYTVARAILDGNVTVEDFQESRFTEPRVLELVKKVGLRSDPFLTKLYPESLGANVEVRFRNGEVLKAGMPHPPGSLQNPADDESLVNKFLSLSESVIGKARARQATDVILSIETASSLEDLLRLVATPSEAG